MVSHCRSGRLLGMSHNAYRLGGWGGCRIGFIKARSATVAEICNCSHSMASGWACLETLSLIFVYTISYA